MAGSVEFADFRRNDIDIVAHYANDRFSKFNQWEDVQNRAKVKAELKLDWTVVNPEIIEKYEKYRPIVFVNGGRHPMDRTDGFADSIIPDGKAFNKHLKQLRQDFTAIYVGNGKQFYDIDCDFDLSGKTSVTDLIDLATISDFFYCQCSFTTILAESLDKPCLTMFTARPQSDRILKTITPKKILCKKTDYYMYDDSDEIHSI